MMYFTILQDEDVEELNNKRMFSKGDKVSVKYQDGKKAAFNKIGTIIQDCAYHVTVQYTDTTRESFLKWDIGKGNVSIKVA